MGLASLTQAWAQSHFLKCRWGVLFNGSTGLVTYLAKPGSLFVSQPIYLDAEKHSGVTIALVMVALCLVDDECRPSVTMHDEAMAYYS